MRKRSKYRPRATLLNPVAYAVESVQPLAAHNGYLTTVKIKNHDAMNALLYGKADVNHMDILINMGNICEALYRLGFGREYQDVVGKGMQALYDVCTRGVPMGKFILKAPEITALNEFMELHDAQMDVITIRDMEKAIELVKDEHRQKKVRKIGEMK